MDLTGFIAVETDRDWKTTNESIYDRPRDPLRTPEAAFRSLFMDASRWVPT